MGTTSTEFLAPRRQGRKEKYFTIFSELGVLGVLALAPWNTDSTKIELFACSAIPQGSPRGVLALVETIQHG